ncbi:MAG: hypothetical protein ACLTCI_11870 [[Clostridium] nexile]
MDYPYTVQFELRLAKEGNRDGRHIFLTDAMEDCQSMTRELAD